MDRTGAQERHGRSRPGPRTRESLEELAEEIWALREEGRNLLETVVGGSKLPDSRATFREMQDRGLVTIDGEKVHLTGRGEGMARAVIRRHRLAEVLLQEVLEVAEAEADRTACEFEHLLSEAVTDSVCTYLGHPPVCPHGKSIPKGRCCDRLAAEMEPLVVRLTDLRPGETGRIVFILPAHQARLAKLSSLGVVPGHTLRLDRKRPSVVVEMGESTIALDRELGKEIYVKKLNRGR